MRVFVFATAATAAVAVTLGLAPSALAIGEVSCGGGAVKVNWKEPGGAVRASCYSEVGELGVDLPRVSSVEAGANFGRVEYTGADGSLRAEFFNPGQIVQIGGWHVSKVRIF